MMFVRFSYCSTPIGVGLLTVYTVILCSKGCVDTRGSVATSITYFLHTTRNSRTHKTCILEVRIQWVEEVEAVRATPGVCGLSSMVWRLALNVGWNRN